jgi:phosphatidate phosphatase APP1
VGHNAEVTDAGVHGPSDAPQPLHRAARVEDAVHARLERRLRRRGWRPRILGYTGYGTSGPSGRIRVLGRVLLAPPGVRRLEGVRGWRRFVSAKVRGVEVAIEIGGRTHLVTTRRGGYVDTVLAVDLPPGWTLARLSTEGAAPAYAGVHVVGPDARLGLVSDIDDTVVITALPRPLRAFWNTFVRRESARRPVPGMAELYRDLSRNDPNVFVVYLSTGAWNVASALEDFLSRHGFPRGPLLMTDWGPTPEAWFRSGREHKADSLRRLLRELPHLRWVLVGDDGQHDPEIYAEAAAAAPEAIRAVLIRELTPKEQVRTHGSSRPSPGSRERPEGAALDVRGPDGYALLARLRSRTQASGKPWL